jgi:2-iminobutanoate/2-iminopropanoate deaminase
MTELTRQRVATTAFARDGALGPYSQAWAVPPNRGLLYTTGVIARDAAGAFPFPYDAEAQTRQVMENLKALLAEAGCGLEDVVKITVFMRDIDKDLETILGVRNEYWPVDPPVSSGVEVSRLVHDDVVVEIEAVAVLPENYWA